MGTSTDLARYHEDQSGCAGRAKYWDNQISNRRLISAIVQLRRPRWRVNQGDMQAGVSNGISGVTVPSLGEVRGGHQVLVAIHRQVRATNVAAVVTFGGRWQKQPGTYLPARHPQFWWLGIVVRTSQNVRSPRIRGQLRFSRISVARYGLSCEDRYAGTEMDACC